MGYCEGCSMVLPTFVGEATSGGRRCYRPWAAVLRAKADMLQMKEVQMLLPVRGGATIVGGRCYRRRAALLPSAASGAPRCYRKCGEVLPSTARAATMGARRCYHGRPTVLS